MDLETYLKCCSIQ